VATVVNENTAYNFVMPDTTGADLEIPWLVGNDAASVSAICTVAVPSGAQIDSYTFALQADTLVTSVTQSTGPFAPSGTETYVSMNGWRADAGSNYDFHQFTVAVEPNSLGTTRRQAIKLQVKYNVANANVYESSGDDPLSMSVSILLVEMRVRDDARRWTLGGT
jgi:hypothetical protein